MSLFEKMFGGPKGNSAENKEEKREPNFVHIDFKNIDGVWRTNNSYIDSRDDGTLPGLSVDFLFDEENLDKVLEDFPSPAIVRQIGPHEYMGKAFVTEDNFLSIEEHLTHGKAKITDAPDFENTEKSVA